MAKETTDDPIGHLAGPVERRDFLQRLAASLSGQEVRLMLEELNKRDFRRDILANLPVELHTNIVQYFDIVELWPCLNVSKRWRQILLDSHIVKTMAHRLLPGLLEYRDERERTSPPGAPPLDSLEDAFLKGMRARYRRRSGKFRWAVSASILFPMARSFPLDPAHHPAVSRTLKMYLNSGPASSDGYADSLFYDYVVDIKYNSGRICWHPQMNKPWIVVDNLRTCLRRVYTVPNLVLEGAWVRVEYLGDKLLVGSVGRVFHAWDLDTGDHESKTMPGIGKVLRSDGDRIWVDFEDVDQHILWKFRCGTQTLQTKGLKDSILGDGGVPFADASGARGRELIFHPADETVAFLFLLYNVENDNTGGTFQVLGVFKFKEGAFSTATWHQLPPANLAYELNIRRANEYGEFVLVDMEDKEVIHNALTANEEPRISVLYFNALTENLFTKQFAALGPRSHHQSQNAQAVWEDRMMSHNSIDLGRRENLNSFLRNFVTAQRAISDPDRDGPIVVYSPERQPNEMGNRPLFHAHETGLATPYIKSGINNCQAPDVRGKGALVEARVEYCLGIGREMSRVDQVISSAVYADEDFVVLVLNNCWMAWNFTSAPPEVPVIDPATTSDNDVAMDGIVKIGRGGRGVGWAEDYSPGSALESSALDGIPPRSPMQPEPGLETGLGAPLARERQTLESLMQLLGEGPRSQ